MQRTTSISWDTTFRNPTDVTVLNAAGAPVAKTDWLYNSAGEPLAQCQDDPTVSGATS